MQIESYQNFADVCITVVVQTLAFNPDYFLWLCKLFSTFLITAHCVNDCAANYICSSEKHF